MTDITAESCVSTMTSGWIDSFGSPEVISTDRSRQFTSGLWQPLDKRTDKNKE